MKVKAVKVNRAHYFLTDPRTWLSDIELISAEKNAAIVARAGEPEPELEPEPF